MKMCKALAIHMFIFIIFLSACSSYEAPSDEFITAIHKAYPDLKTQPYSIEQVERVVDGDTFVTKKGVKVRLLGVNTPESVKPNTPVEFFAKEASSFAKSQLSGKTIVMFSDVQDEDRYDRKLRFIFIYNQENEKPEMFNEALLKEGYANTMTIPPNVMYSEHFVQLERQARQQKKGLWSDAQTEIEARAASCSEPKIKGNINSEGEKIYHVPSGTYYDVTIAEEMFCTEEEAISAGYRKAKK